MLRAVLGFVAAAVVWMTAFFAMTTCVAILWPAYAVHGRTWFETGVFTFDPPMAVINILCWALAAALAGHLAVVIARRREVAWALAAVLTMYLGALHLVLNWPDFPWWYNIGVVASAAPAVLLGARLADGFIASSTPSSSSVAKSA